MCSCSLFYDPHVKESQLILLLKVTFVFFRVLWTAVDYEPEDGALQEVKKLKTEISYLSSCVI